MGTKSGKFWLTWADTHAGNSSDVEDLAEPFRTSAKAFIAALRSAGATVTVTATRRHERRAYLFHWSWKVALERIKAPEVPLREDVDIVWDHGDIKASKTGAREMVDGFKLAVPPKSTNPPALSSNHIRGTAIDMQIAWTGRIVVKDARGRSVPITFIADVNANTPLHALGAGYGVQKLRTDAPHWSANGTYWPSADRRWCSRSPGAASSPPADATGPRPRTPVARHPRLTAPPSTGVWAGWMTGASRSPTRRSKPASRSRS